MTENQDSTAASTVAAKSDGHHDHGELGFYFKIFYALLVLTVVTVAIAYLPLPEWAAMVLAMVVASIKGTLVVLYFMHLKTETKNIYIIAGVPLVLAVILLLALGPDIAGWAGT